MRRPRHPHAPKRERALDRLADLVRGLTPDRREALVRDVLDPSLERPALLLERQEQAK